VRPGSVIEVFFPFRPPHHWFQGPPDERRTGEGVLRAGTPVLEEKLGAKKRTRNWEGIVEFMAGRKPEQMPAGRRDLPGTEKSIAIVYQASMRLQNSRCALVRPIRQSAPGSIRKEFGQTIMINAAHASDSAENAKREMAIVGPTRILQTFDWKLLPAPIVCAPFFTNLTTSPICHGISETRRSTSPSLTLSIDSKAKAMKAEGMDVLRLRRWRNGFRHAGTYKKGRNRRIRGRLTKYTPSAGIRSCARRSLKKWLPTTTSAIALPRSS